MRHLRKDYDAIQPWPVKRTHIARYWDQADDKGAPQDMNTWPDDQVGEAFSIGLAAPLIPDDEPVFLLRASDPVATSVVHFWANQAERAGSDPVLCERVRQWADEMDAYRDGQDYVKLYPDTPQGMLR